MKKFFALFILIVVLGCLVYFNFFDKKTIDVPTVVDEIKDFNYKLYNNQTKEYKELFNELKDLLEKDNIDYNKYAELLSKMFIIDFYTLDNKTTNLNIGGVDFVYSSMKENFKLNAKDTMYKYLKSNLYKDRKQQLPYVTNVNVDDIKIVTFYYKDKKENKTDSKCYQVTLSWDYKKDLGYDKSKVLYLVHEDKNLSIVEMSDIKA